MTARDAAIPPSLSFSDIADDDEIQRLLDRPDTFDLRTIRAETLVDWVPDLGSYVASGRSRSRNGVFRTPGLAASAIPAQLRHRFWLPNEAAAVAGDTHIGLLLYDSDQDDVVYELSQGSDTIGTIRPWRHDNQRHLLVAAVPHRFQGGHVPLGVVARGVGPAYLESVVFLKACPDASSFVPRIDRLSTGVTGWFGGRVTARVHLVTASRARLTIDAIPDDERGGPTTRTITEGYHRLHAVTVDDLGEARRYRVEVTAEERGGETDVSSTILDTTEVNPATGLPPAPIPIEIVQPAIVGAGLMPMTFGVPISSGLLSTAPIGQVRWQGGSSPAQTRIHSRWPDGSARWLLVDSTYPSAVEAGALSAELDLASTPPASEGLRWSRSAGGVQVETPNVRVSVAAEGPLPASIDHRTSDGHWQRLRPSDLPFLSGVLGDGTPFCSGRPTEIELEEAGAQRVVIRYEVPLADDDGVQHMLATVRMHVFAQPPFLRLTVRCVVTDPSLGPAFGRRIPEGSGLEAGGPDEASGGQRGEGDSLLSLRSLELSLPGGDPTISEHQRIVHYDDRSYELTYDGSSQTVEGHAKGAIEVGSGDDHLLVCVKDFWQTYPKGLRLDGAGLALEILPPLDTTKVRDGDDTPKMRFWLDRDTSTYRVKVGMALTSDILIGFPSDPPDVEAWQSWFEGPPAVRPSIEYLNATNALPPIAPKVDSPMPGYEMFMDTQARFWIDQVAERHEYGFLNWGDTYSDVEEFWSNNEYDASLCQYVEFLRGGDRSWHSLALRTARHLIDIDTCNHSSEPGQVGAQYMHTPGHAGGFLPPFFRSKMAGSVSVPSHMWVEGEGLHYALMGDETAREVLLATGHGLLRGLDDYDFANARECGWHLVHLSGMAQIDDDPRYLNAASIIVDTVLRKQEPGGGWEHPLSEAHCHCEPPRCRGEAGFMVGVLLSGLRRYHRLTGDARVAEAIVGGARWLAAKTFDPISQGFRYTSCPSRSDFVSPTIQLVEGLAAASALDDDPVVGAVFRAAVAGLGHSGPTANESVYGNRLSMEARYLPFTLPYLTVEGSASTRVMTSDVSR
jgi:hypothetical protein